MKKELGCEENNTMGALSLIGAKVGKKFFGEKD